MTAIDVQITARPDGMGPVAIEATGPRPDRKDGACFHWKAVE